MVQKHPHAGRLANLAVRDWLEQHRTDIELLPFILISSIDSSRQVSTMNWVSDRLRVNPAWALSISPLVISGAASVSLLDEAHLFTGFDELWVPAAVPTPDPPNEAFLVAPRNLETEIPHAVLEWMRISRCRLGVGDGDGMNYVVNDRELGSTLGLV